MSQGNHPDHPPVEGGYRGTTTPQTNIRAEIDKAHLLIFLARCAVLSGTPLNTIDKVITDLSNYGQRGTVLGFYWTADHCRSLAEQIPFAAEMFAQHFGTRVAGIARSCFNHDTIMKVVRSKTTYVAKEFNKLFQKTAADQYYTQYKRLDQ